MATHKNKPEPKYRKHSTRNRAFVQINSKRKYLPGNYGSAESHQAYREVLTQLRRERLGGTKASKPKLSGASLAELCAQYLVFAAGYYGESLRSEFGNLMCAIKLLRTHVDDTIPVTTFSAVNIEELQSSLVKAGLSRSYINQTISKIKRIFKWGFTKKIVPLEAYHSVTAAAPLRKGRTKAPEKKKKKPIRKRQFDLVLAEVPKHIRDMMLIQRYTGVRSGSLVRAKAKQFRESRKHKMTIWKPRLKTEWKDVELIIPIGPRCLEILKPYLESAKPDDYLFSPKASRKNPRYNDRYSSGSFCHAIHRAIDKINKRLIASGGKRIAKWSPHAIRHLKGRRTREKYGIEAAQAILGHESIEATEIYSTRRQELARRVAKETG